MSICSKSMSHIETHDLLELPTEHAVESVRLGLKRGGNGVGYRFQGAWKAKRYLTPFLPWPARRLNRSDPNDSHSLGKADRRIADSRKDRDQTGGLGLSGSSGAERSRSSCS